MTMSRNDDFVRFSTNGSLTSESEYETNYSTADHTVSSHGQNLSRRTDYWFGKKYFECIIAQDIFEKGAEDDTIETVDSLFEETLRNYPFREAVNRLRSEVSQSLSSSNLPKGASDYAALMTFLGMTIRLGEQYDRRNILRIIRNLHVKDPDDSDKPPSTIGPRGPTVKVKSESPTFDSFSQIDENEGPSIDTYTSRLKEIGDQQGWRPEYSGGRYRKDQSLFQMTVSFNGLALEGLPARNQRLAKHQASKAACDFLDSQRRSYDTMSDF